MLKEMTSNSTEEKQHKCSAEVGYQYRTNRAPPCCEIWVRQDLVFCANNNCLGNLELELWARVPPWVLGLGHFMNEEDRFKNHLGRLSNPLSIKEFIRAPLIVLLRFPVGHPPLLLKSRLLFLTQAKSFLQPTKCAPLLLDLLSLSILINLSHHSRIAHETHSHCARRHLATTKLRRCMSMIIIMVIIAGVCGEIGS